MKLSFIRPLLYISFIVFVFSNIGFSQNASEENKIQQLKENERIAIFWDSSLSRKSNNLSTEINILEAHLNDLLNEKSIYSIDLILFADTSPTILSLTLSEESISQIIQRVRQIQYNGASDLNVAFNGVSALYEKVILFTEGQTIFNISPEVMSYPVTTISSINDDNEVLLRQIAEATRGNYISLYSVEIPDALAILRGDELIKDVVKPDKPKSNDIIYGVVHNESGPIQGAKVGIRGSFNQVSTGSNGMYRISASEGDILQIQAFGMETRELTVGSEKKMHVKMEPDGELLEEVTVTGKKSEAETVDTAFESKKKGSVGYSLSNRVTADQIGAYQTDLFQVMQKMPGVIVVGQTTGNPKYKLRRTQNNSLRGDNFPAFVLDGMVVDQATQQVPFINPQQIKSITILASANAAIRYGQLAANGAIVVETKKAEDIPDYVPEETLDQVKGNDYSDLAMTVEELLDQESAPAYVKNIKNAAGAAAAKEAYLKALAYQNQLTVDFFIKSALAMRTHNEAYAVNILFNISEIAPQNIKALKTLAFYLESMNKDEAATPVYERLVNLDPAAVQSYLDLARNYKRVGSYDLAATLYKQMVANSIPNVDFTDAAVTVFNDFKQLVALHKSKIDYSNIPEAILKVGYKKDIRIVLEWNEPLADFDLQFVSPKKKFFQVSHSVYGNVEAIKNEIKNGVYSKEFEVEDAEKGTWLVNITYNGDKDDLNPAVLKYTLYRNYGLPNEERVVKAIKLSDLPEKVSLDTFVY